MRYRNRALHCLTANQSAGCLLEQGENALRQLVGLGQHGGAGLLQDLTTGQGGGFCCKIGVLDPAARCREIFRGGLQVADGALEAVLQSTVLGALVIHGCQGRINDGQGQLRIVVGGYIKAGYSFER